MTGSGLSRNAVVRVAVVVATLVFGAPSLTHPFGFDQANQAQAAAMVLDGATPFSEVPSLKPPMTLAFHGLAIALFGNNMTAVRLLDLLWTALTALVLAACAARLWKGLAGAGVLSGIAYVHTYYCFGFWHSAQTDGWMNLPIAAAMWLVLWAWDSPRAPTRRSAMAWGGVGALTVAALLFKYSAAGFLALFTLAAIACFLQGKRPGIIALGGFAAGVLLATGVFVAVLQLWGAWHGYVHDHLATAVRYADSASSPGSTAAAEVSLVGRLFRHVFDVRPATTLLLGSPKTFLLGAAGATMVTVLAVRRTTTFRDRGRLALLLGWLGAGWMSTAVQGRYFGYHFLPLLAPWALLAGVLCARAACLVRAKVAARWARWLSLPVLALLFVWSNRGPFFYPYMPLHVQYEVLGHVVGGASLEETWQHGPYEVAPNYSVRETVAVVRYLREHGSSGDSLFIWGSNQAIYFLAQRPRISLITTAFQATAQRVAAGSTRGEERLLADLQRTPPSIILVQHGDSVSAILGHDLDSYALLARAPPVLAFFQAHYRQAQRIGRFDVLTRAAP